MTDPLEQQSQVTAPQESAANSFSVPDVYKDRGWVEKIKSPDDLWKTLDNAQSLLGKRPAGIPAADAPDEEWQKFYQSARPEKADDYALGDVEGIPEGVDMTPYKKQAQELMHDAGLTKKQADALWKKYVGLEMGAVASKTADLDKRYDDTLNSIFGEKRAEAESTAQEAMKRILPPELLGHVNALGQNPEAMGVVIKLVNEMNSEIQTIKKEYGAEGNLPGNGEQVAALDINESVQKLAKLRLSPEAQDFTKPGHKKAMDEIAALQAVVARHFNK